MKNIELSEQTVSALQRQAVAHSMTLQAWLEELSKAAIAEPSLHTLKELMQQCATQAPIEDDTRARLDDGPVGREAF